VAERRFYTGLEISKHHLSLVQLEKTTMGWLLEARAQRDIAPNTLHMSIKEKPVRNTENFNNALLDLLKKIKINNRNIAVSLPSEIVKLSLIPLNVSLMDHEETIQTIKWKLQETVPYDTDYMRVSFQKISPGRDGEESVLATVVNREIVEQFEQLLVRRKLKAEIIGVSSLNHLNLYSNYLKKNNFTMILSLFEDYFFFAAFDECKVAYFRGKKISPFTAAGSREISSTIDYYLSEVEKEKKINKLGISIETEDMKNLEHTLNKLYSFEICLLNPVDAIPSLGNTEHETTINSYTSALGAAQMLYYKL
jgi:Tfp pilus assembly PilM family ATPase